MADIQIRRKQEKKLAESVRPQFRDLIPGLWAKWNSATPQQQSNQLGGLASWDFQAAQPSTARENTLYAGLVLVMLMVGYLWIQVIGRDD